MEQWKYLVLLKAIAEAQIEAAGMQAENQIRISLGHSLAYDANAFQEVLQTLNNAWETNRP